MIRALLGGSFDPVHAGHVAMAAHVLVHGLADRVVVIPNWRSPWRPDPAASAADRLAMCRLAFAGMPEVAVDDREIAGGQAAFTVDTLETLVATHPGDTWRVIIGGDHLGGFSRWERASRILELAELIVLERPAARARTESTSVGMPGARLVAAPPFDHPVSASAVRAMLGAGDAASAPLPPAVADYIAAHQLYRAH